MDFLDRLEGMDFRDKQGLYFYSIWNRILFNFYLDFRAFLEKRVFVELTAKGAETEKFRNAIIPLSICINYRLDIQAKKETKAIHFPDLLELMDTQENLERKGSFRAIIL